MLTALVHFAIGFSAVSGITYAHARLLQETNGSFLSAGLITGLVCASLATFATEWVTPVVIVLFGLSSHKEYLEARRYKAQSEATGLESKKNVASNITMEPDA